MYTWFVHAFSLVIDIPFFCFGRVHVTMKLGNTIMCYFFLFL